MASRLQKYFKVVNFVYFEKRNKINPEMFVNFSASHYLCFVH
jgi:hypothetical protein